MISRTQGSNEVGAEIEVLQELNNLRSINKIQQNVIKKLQEHLDNIPYYEHFEKWLRIKQRLLEYVEECTQNHRQTSRTQLKIIAHSEDSKEQSKEPKT